MKYVFCGILPCREKTKLPYSVELDHDHKHVCLTNALNAMMKNEGWIVDLRDLSEESDTNYAQ